MNVMNTVLRNLYWEFVFRLIYRDFEFVWTVNEVDRDYYEEDEMAGQGG